MKQGEGEMRKDCVNVCCLLLICMYVDVVTVPAGVYVCVVVYVCYASIKLIDCS